MPTTLQPEDGPAFSSFAVTGTHRQGAPAYPPVLRLQGWAKRPNLPSRVAKAKGKRKATALPLASAAQAVGPCQGLGRTRCHIEGHIRHAMVAGHTAGGAPAAANQATTLAGQRRAKLLEAVEGNGDRCAHQQKDGRSPQRAPPGGLGFASAGSLAVTARHGIPFSRQRFPRLAGAIGDSWGGRRGHGREDDGPPSPSRHRPYANPDCAPGQRRFYFPANDARPRIRMRCFNAALPRF